MVGADHLFSRLVWTLAHAGILLPGGGRKIFALPLLISQNSVRFFPARALSPALSELAAFSRPDRILAGRVTNLDRPIE
jgi:hypothetical protein